MLYYEIVIEKGISDPSLAPFALTSYVRDRVSFEARNEVFDGAVRKAAQFVAAFGFDPERDDLSIRLRVYGADPGLDHEVLQRWQLHPYRENLAIPSSVWAALGLPSAV